MVGYFKFYNCSRYKNYKCDGEIRFSPGGGRERGMHHTLPSNKYINLFRNDQVLGEIRLLCEGQGTNDLCYAQSGLFLCVRRCLAYVCNVWIGKQDNSWMG